jgi:ATP-binding cassette subfamily B protein
VEAAKMAQIHDFIERLPDKYQTRVGERGVKISGGEKQRVAIARAMLIKPKIILFDEATSSLDSKSEQAILTTLKNVAKGRTTIAIAHRLSTIIDSDIIYVLQHGQVVEKGTHSELLRQSGVYAQLWKLQSQARENAVK